MDQINPALLERRDVRAALAAHEIGTVYRLLVNAGIAQRRLAALTGTSQSQVSEILHGRRVSGYDVLVRIADGLGVPRGWMGLSYGPDGAYCGAAGVSDHLDGEVTEEMRRRAFLAAAAAAACGSPVLGDALELPAPSEAPTPLPSRLGMHDVHAVRDLTERLRLVARTYGGQADTLGALAVRSARLMNVAGPATVKSALGGALAELHTTAGWACYDTSADDQARAHFTTALQLATAVDDPTGAASALRHAGIMTTQRGAPNDGLKLYQLAQFRLADVRRGDPDPAALGAWLTAHCASALVDLGHPADGLSQLAAARDGWQPPDAFEQADMDWLTAQLYMRLGRIDTAEPFAASSVRAWGDVGRREGAMSEITLAQLHVTAGEVRGLELAHRAIGAVAHLRSQRARDRLLPLADALRKRPGSQARELSVLASRVAAAPA